MKFTNKILLTGTLLAGAGAFALQTPGAGSAGQVPTSPSTASPSSPASQAPYTQSPSSQQPGMQSPGAQPGTPGSAPSAQPEQAPPPQPGRPSIDDQVKMLTQELSLNTDQQAKLKNILEDQHQQALTFVNDANMSREDKIQKIRVLREATITKARGIMNDDQKKKLDAMLQQQQPPHNQQSPGSQQPPSSQQPPASQQSPAGQPPANRPPQ
jgi:hypothetical protein